MTLEEKIRMERKQAFAEGEAIEKRETARRMKADGMAAELISKYTGLSTEEIKKL